MELLLRFGGRILWPGLLGLWLCACVSVLWFTVSTWAPGPMSDAGVVFVYGMLFLTFPAGLIVPLAVAATATAFGQASAGVEGVGWLAVLWVAFVVLGYMQWLYLVPRVWRWARGQRRAV